MDGEVTVTIIGVAILIIGNIVGWFITINRAGKKDAREAGKLEGAVEGLHGYMEGAILNMKEDVTGLANSFHRSIDNAHKRMDTLEKRVNDHINGTRS